MAYNLTETQKKLARFLVEQVQAGNLPESFRASESSARPGELLAGIPIGATVDVLENSLDKDAQIGQAHDNREKIYSYVHDSVQIDFFVQRSKTYLITLHKRA